MQILERWKKERDRNRDKAERLKRQNKCIWWKQIGRWRAQRKCNWSWKHFVDDIGSFGQYQYINGWSNPKS